MGGNEGMSGSVTFSQRGGAQAELSRDGASLSYNGADGIPPFALKAQTQQANFLPAVSSVKSCPEPVTM